MIIYLDFKHLIFYIFIFFNINMNKIKIYPIKEFEDECKLPRPINNILMDCKGDVGLFVGKICSGKSVLLQNILLRDELLRGIHESIYLISNTAGCDDSSRFLVAEDNCRVYEKYSDKLIRDIVDAKKELKKKDMKWDIIVADDILGSCKTNPPCELFQLTTRLRHYAFNMIILTQKMKCVSPVVRTNTTYLVVFWNLYGKELDQIGEEWGNFCGDRGFVDLYKKHIQKSKYSFMYINFKKGIVMKNFDKILYSIDNGYEDSDSEESDSEESD